MNTEAIAEAYNEEERFQPFFDHFASRQRNYAETKVNRLQHVLVDEGAEISRGDVIAFLRKLEALGCGQFVVGRRGWESRFLWSVNMVDVGRAATGEAEEIEALPVSEEADDSSPEGDDMLVHVFNLRPDCVISISLPSDLTDREASRISAFVGSLPFEE